jgi:hypothetical protein
MHTGIRTNIIPNTIPNNTIAVSALLGKGAESHKNNIVLSFLHRRGEGEEFTKTQ